MSLSQDNLVDTIPTLYEEFDISFELYIHKGQGISRRNVLRLTNTNDEKGNIGDRIVVFEVYGDLSKSILLSDSTKPKSLILNEAVPSQKWIPIRIQQAVIEGKFQLMFWVDGESAGGLMMDTPQVFNNTRVLLGDSYTTALYGTIKNLTISTGNLLNFFIFTDFAL